MQRDFFSRLLFLQSETCDADIVTRAKLLAEVIMKKNGNDMIMLCDRGICMNLGPWGIGVLGRLEGGCVRFRFL